MRHWREPYGKEKIATIAHAKDVKLSWVKPGVLNVEADADLLLASKVWGCRVLSETESSITFDVTRVDAPVPKQLSWLAYALISSLKRPDSS